MRYCKRSCASIRLGDYSMIVRAIVNGENKFHIAMKERSPDPSTERLSAFKTISLLLLFLLLLTIRGVVRDRQMECTT